VLLASVGLAMDSAEQAEKSANQVSLFGGDDSDLETPLTYVNVPPWGEKQRLTEEKTALGFYLSGHLFTAYEAEVRKFARTRLSSLEPSRDPRMIAGIIVGVRAQMTQRGKIVIVTLDDGSSTADVTIYSELAEPNRAILKEDELLVVQGKVSEDRFSGGMRVSAEKVMDIGAARAQYGKQFSVASSGGFDIAQLKTILSPYRSDSGLPFVLDYTNDGVNCEVRWPAAWLVKPADELKSALMDKLGLQKAETQYF
jgi:DNA polymerase-3 subunit alpha